MSTYELLDNYCNIIGRKELPFPEDVVNSVLCFDKYKYPINPSKAVAYAYSAGVAFLAIWWFWVFLALLTIFFYFSQTNSLYFTSII